MEPTFGSLQPPKTMVDANKSQVELNERKMEIVDESEFNIVRGFNTTGKIIRVKAQIKPGLIHGYDPIAGLLI